MTKKASYPALVFVRCPECGVVWSCPADKPVNRSAAYRFFDWPHRRCEPCAMRARQKAAAEAAQTVKEAHE